MDGANSFIRGLFVDGSGTNPENLQILAFSLYLTITENSLFIRLFRDIRDKNCSGSASHHVKWNFFKYKTPPFNGFLPASLVRYYARRVRTLGGAVTEKTPPGV
jgi:hypothetical protein